MQISNVAPPVLTRMLLNKLPRKECAYACTKTYTHRVVISACLYFCHCYLFVFYLKNTKGKRRSLAPVGNDPLILLKDIKEWLGKVFIRGIIIKKTRNKCPAPRGSPWQRFKGQEEKDWGVLQCTQRRWLRKERFDLFPPVPPSV